MFRRNEARAARLEDHGPPLFTHLTRALGLAAIIAIAIVTLVPGPMRPHSGAPAAIEHVVAYAGTASLLVMGFGSPLAIWALLSVVAAALEIAQYFVPDRHPAAHDFLLKALGVGIGVVITIVLTAVKARRPSSSAPEHSGAGGGPGRDETMPKEKGPPRPDAGPS